MDAKKVPVITLCLTHFETNNSRSFKAQLYFEIIKERWVKGLTCFMWWCWQCDCYLKENKAWSRFGSFLVSNLWWTFFIDLKNMIYYWGFQGNMKHRNTLKQDFLIFKNSQLLLLTIKNLFTHTRARARGAPWQMLTLIRNECCFLCIIASEDFRWISVLCIKKMTSIFYNF